MKISQSFYFILVVVFLCFQCKSNSSNSNSTSLDSLSRTARIYSETKTPVGHPAVDQYLSLIQEALKKEIPVLTLQRDLSKEEKVVQDIVLLDTDFLKMTKDKDGKVHRNEIFGIYPARVSDILKSNAEYWKLGQCYRVEMYNFALNTTTIALVSVPSAKVFQCSYFLGMQPELPPHLKEIAIVIARENESVIESFGGKPSELEALMPDTKTALNASRCERSKHLCVAPTFVKGDRALWAIVDLTDLRLAGTRWTNLGETPTIVTPTISERQIQNEFISQCYCNTEIELEKSQWDLKYMITGNDGLRISDVKFKGGQVIDNAKLVDWHVSYSKTDGFGYSDAVGCPYFSSATVVAVEAPKVLDIMEAGRSVGFAIEQFYRSDGWPSPCNYQYFQRYEFYNDGRFRISAANIGRGCGNDGTYRPVFRIALSGKENEVGEWDGQVYQPINKEGWRLQQPTTRYDNLAMFRLKTGDGLYKLVPGNGQFNDGGRGDNAYVYFTVNKAEIDEGETDLPTIGPCCNIDYKQGPEKFIEPMPESLKGQQVVVWYVPQIKNDDTKGKEYCWAEAKLVNGVYQTQYYPCVAGPMFVPEKLSSL